MRKKGATSALSAVDDMQHSLQFLALRELERFTGLGTAVLLALHGTGVASKESALLQDRAQSPLEVGHGLGDSIPPPARLPGQTAAGHSADYVILSGAGSSD